MGIRDRLRKQRELERQQLETDQQTVPEAIESVISDMVEKVVLATIPEEESIVEEGVEEPIVEEVVVELIVEEVKEEAVVEPIVEEVKEEAVVEPIVEEVVVEAVVELIVEEAVVEPIVEEAVVEESCTLSSGTYRISGFYKQGLELYFDDFTLKPTSSCLLCGNSRIKGFKNPFMALLNQRYVLIVTIDPYLLSIKIGKTIINEKMRINTVLSNQDITIEKID